MPTELKVKQVAEIEERLKRAVITIGLDYRGLSVTQMRDLRLALRAVEPTIEMRVVKNTLVKRAAENAGHADIAQLTKQATALVFGYEEQNSPPKGITKFLTDSRLELTIHGGYMDGVLLTPDEVADLATIPSRLELMAKIAGGVANPITGIAAVLHAILRDTAAVIEARAAQLAEQEGEPPAADEASDATTNSAAQSSSDDDTSDDDTSDDDTSDDDTSDDDTNDDDTSGDDDTSDDDTSGDPAEQPDPKPDDKTD